MVVDNAGCLHEGVARGRSDERTTEFPQRATQRVRYFRAGRRVRVRSARSVDRRAADKRPHECREGAVLSLNSLYRASVGDSGCDLRPVADDAGIEQEFGCIVFREGGDPVDIEVVKQRLVALALVKNRRPGQAGLSALEHEHFEEMTIVVRGDAPFRVVIVGEGRRAHPAAAVRLGTFVGLG